MLAAARAADWDGLVAHEKQCAARLSLLIADQPEEAQTPAFRQRKAELIHQMLAHDAEIRLLVEPRLATLSAFLGNSRQQSRLHQTYRSA
jgi:Flagellar protein FliT